MTNANTDVAKDQALPRPARPLRLSPSDYQTLSPFRTLEWRYDRVVQVLDASGGRQTLSRKRDDRTTFLLKEFLVAYRRHSDRSYRESVFTRYPIPYLAYELQTNSDNHYRQVVQARILARQTDIDIGARIHLPGEVVDFYEKCFFNVRDRLDRPDWIVRQIYGRQAARGLAGSEEQIMLKLFAYFAGPIAFEFLQTGFTSVRHLRSKDEITAMLDQYMTSTVRRRAALHANTFEVTRHNIMQLLELHTKILEIDRLAAKEGQAQTLVEKAIEEFCIANPWVIVPTAEARDIQKLVEYDRGAVEIRDSELHRLAQGEVIDVSPAVVDDRGRVLSPTFEARKHHEHQDGPAESKASRSGEGSDDAGGEVASQ